MERKSDVYIRLSESATSDIAKLPQWMQHNLKPVKTSDGKTFSRSEDKSSTKAKR